MVPPNLDARAMADEPSSHAADPSPPSNPATRRRYLSGLRYAHHKCCDAAILFASQSAASGLSTTGGAKLHRVATEFASARDTLRSTLLAHGRSPLLRRHFSAPPMRLWARATRLSGELFCIDMAAHMSRKLALILGNLARFADAEDLPLDASRLKASSLSLADTASALHPQAPESEAP